MTSYRTRICARGGLFSLMVPTVPIYHRPPHLRLLSFWAPEGCTPTTPFCGRRRPEQTSIKSFGASAKSFTRPEYSVSRKGGKNVLIMDTLWKNNRNFMNDVSTISIDFIIIAIVVSEKKIRGITFVPPLFCASFDNVNGTRY